MKFKEIFIILAICAVVMFFADLLHDDELEDFSVYLRCAGGVLTVIAGVFIMGLPFIKHKDSHFIKNMDLWVLHTPEQLKYALFQLGVGLLIPVTGINIIGIGMPLYNSWGILLFQLFFVLPGLSFLILSYFVKTTYVTFAKSSQDVSFISEKFSFTVPFDSIKFITERIISGKGGSSYMVAIHSSKKPAMLFSSKVNGGVNRLSSPLLTLIATYNCTTRKEAEESIDDLLLFMAGKYDDSPSKFDDIWILNIDLRIKRIISVWLARIQDAKEEGETAYDPVIDFKNLQPFLKKMLMRSIQIRIGIAKVALKCKPEELKKLGLK